jgi:hypothetical protein
MRKNKFKQQPGDTVVTVKPVIAERAAGAATSASTTVVIDNVDVVTSHKDALNVPSVNPSAEGDDRQGFKALVKTKKKDR